MLELAGIVAWVPPPTRPNPAWRRAKVNNHQSVDDLSRPLLYSLHLIYSDVFVLAGCWAESQPAGQYGHQGASYHSYHVWRAFSNTMFRVASTGR